MRRHIAFLRRGSLVRLDDVSPALTLLDYLRLDERAMGTKEGCAEGDCGACTVVLRRLDGERLVYTPVNACIVLAGQADGSDVICVDDLAADGLHPVQQALVDLHGSQCGFCTPGFVMALFALFHDPARAAVTRATVNDWIAGNSAAALATVRSSMPRSPPAPARGATASPMRKRRSQACWPVSTTTPTSWSARPIASSPRRRASRHWRLCMHSTPMRSSSPGDRRRAVDHQAAAEFVENYLARAGSRPRRDCRRRPRSNLRGDRNPRRRLAIPRRDRS